MGSGLKARLIWVSKKDKHTALSELLRRRDIDIRPHTHTHSKSRLHWALLINECQKPILILNEQLDDGVGIASLLETFSHSCFPRISKIIHRALKHFWLNKLAIICHGDNSLPLVFNTSTDRSLVTLFKLLSTFLPNVIAYLCSLSPSLYFSLAPSAQGDRWMSLKITVSTWL